MTEHPTLTHGHPAGEEIPTDDIEQLVDGRLQAGACPYCLANALALIAMDVMAQAMARDSGREMAATVRQSADMLADDMKYAAMGYIERHRQGRRH